MHSSRKKSVETVLTTYCFCSMLECNFMRIWNFLNRVLEKKKENLSLWKWCYDKQKKHTFIYVYVHTHTHTHTKVSNISLAPTKTEKGKKEILEMRDRFQFCVFIEIWRMSKREKTNHQNSNKEWEQYKFSCFSSLGNIKILLNH